MTVMREMDLTWQGASRPFAPSVMSIMRIENNIRKVTGRPDFSISHLMARMEDDPVVFAAVWGAMLHLAGHKADDDVSEADAIEWWYQEAWQAITSLGVDDNALADLNCVRDIIIAMVAPSVDLGKPAAPRAKAPSGGAAKKKGK